MKPLLRKPDASAPRRGRTALLAACALGAAVTLGGCEPKTALRGNLPRDSQMQQLQVGQDDKDRVAELFGTPSTIGTFDNDVWYYMSTKTEQWAFFEPTIVDHQILALYFNGAGVLENMATYTEEDLRAVEYADRTTPTSGREFTLLEQLFGNYSRFRQ